MNNTPKSRKLMITGIVAGVVLLVFLILSLSFAFSSSTLPNVNFFSWSLEKIGEYFSFRISETKYTFLYIVCFILVYVYGFAIIGGTAYGIFVLIKTKHKSSLLLVAVSLSLLIPFYFAIGGSCALVKALISAEQFENDSSAVLHVTLALSTLLLFAVYTVSAVVFFVEALKYSFRKDEEKQEEPAPSVRKENAENDDVFDIENISDESEEVDIENMTKEEIAELIRQIVREELAHTPQSNPAPTVNFGQPLVVQYFNGPAPVPGNKKAARIASAPVQEIGAEAEEAPVAEVKPVEAPVTPTVAEPVEEKAEPAATENVVTEPAPAEAAPESAEAEEEGDAKTPIVRIPFTERIKNAEDELRANYSAIKNEILAYGVKSRVSNAGDTFRLHRKTYVKLIVAGKGLKLYMALDPKDYADSTIPFQDVSNKAAYTEIPFAFKVKSGLSFRRCMQLIQETMEKDGLTKGEVGNTDWAENISEAAGEDADSED